MKLIEDTLNETCKVLIVDDSQVDRLTYQRYLMKAGSLNAVILESDCGEDGLEMFAQHAPDIILLDYLLPDINGLEFLQVLKGKTLALPPIIMLTGQGDEQVAVEALMLGAQDYLVKNQLSPGQLVQAVRRVLVKQSLELTIARQKRQQQLMAMMADVALRISQSLELEIILETAVVGIRQLLGCDRTLVYHLEPDGTGMVVAESVLPQWSSTLESEIEDPCFQRINLTGYMSGQKTVMSDIYQSNLSVCHIQMLERFQVKASVIVPVVTRGVGNLKKPRLWGFLMAHQCRNTRFWQADELGMLDDLSVQLGIAIQQSELVSTLEKRAEALTEINQQLARVTRTMKVNRQN